jgi:diaminohydroxyphosphoribosylaminopyrimidine deaminase/5-amino-6-(5-phosphoribosylamino)uracil reductase
MREALACAMSASGRSNPNPAVGCVTVKDGNAIASGATSGMGTAMPMVIDSVSNSDLLRGATIYIRCCRCSPTLH